MDFAPAFQPGRPGPKTWNSRVAAAMALVALVTLVSFLNSLHNGLLQWDDQKYVTENPAIRSFSWGNLERLLVSPAETSYVPVVNLSFAADYAVWGLNPFGYHLTNLLLHIVDTLLVLFLVLRLEGSLLAAVAAGLLFGVHPLRVESVVWVSERKDLLSALFFLLAFFSYLKYREGEKNRFYGLSLFAFLLSLASKSIAVTLPLVLILYDYLSDRTWWSRRALREKVPFFALSMLFGLIEVFSQKSQGGLLESRLYSVGQNLLIAGRNVIFYLEKTLVPVDLSAFYPYPQRVSLAAPAFLGSFLILLILGAAVWISSRYTRKVVFGSLFFLITLLPILKILPFSGGSSSVAADRYTYIPAIGLVYLAGLGVRRLADWKTHWDRLKGIALAAGLAAVVLTLGALTWQRSKVWRDDESLWSSVVNRYPGINRNAYVNLGNVYEKKGELEKAVVEYKEAMVIDPKAPFIYNNLGNIYQKLGRVDAAIAQFKKAISIDPGYLTSYNNLGSAYEKKGELEAAIVEYRKALKSKDFFAPRYNLGVAYAKKHQFDQAIAEFQAALAINPDDALTHQRLGTLWQLKGDLKQAIAEYRRAIDLDSRKPGFYRSLAAALRADGQRDAARIAAERASSIAAKNAPGIVKQNEAAGLSPGN